MCVYRVPPLRTTQIRGRGRGGRGGKRRKKRDRAFYGGVFYRRQTTIPFQKTKRAKIRDEDKSMLTPPVYLFEYCSGATCGTLFCNYLQKNTGEKRRGYVRRMGNNRHVVFILYMRISTKGRPYAHACKWA